MTNDTKPMYVQRVRELLREEVSGDDLDALTSDLVEQIAGMDAEKVTERLGSPEQFVDAYRTGAGLEQSPQGFDGASRTWRWIHDWLDKRRESSIGQMWIQYQPAWWLIRGWIGLLVFALLSRGKTFSPFPIPDVDSFPTTSFGILIAVTSGSILLGNAARWRGGRIANLVVSAFVAYVAFVGAVNT